jgi:hypothetical protein
MSVDSESSDYVVNVKKHCYGSRKFPYVRKTLYSILLLVTSVECSVFLIVNEVY